MLKLPTFYAQKFKWTTIPPLELLAENVFAGETGISGTWDQYGLRLPSGSMALFLHCRQTNELEAEESHDAWSYYNPDASDDDLREAVSVAEDIAFLCGSKVGSEARQHSRKGVPVLLLS